MTRHAHLFKDFGEKIHSFGHCNLAMMELYMARGMDIQFYKRASIRCVFFLKHALTVQCIMRAPHSFTIHAYNLLGDNVCSLHSSYSEFVGQFGCKGLTTRREELKKTSLLVGHMQLAFFDIIIPKAFHETIKPLIIHQIIRYVSNGGVTPPHH